MEYAKADSRKRVDVELEVESVVCMFISTHNMRMSGDGTFDENNG